MSTQTQTGTATTTLQTFTFSPVQNVFKLENKGSTDIQFNVGKYTNKTLHAYDIFEARVDYESFDVITNDGTSEFEATLTNDTFDLDEVEGITSQTTIPNNSLFDGNFITSKYLSGSVGSLVLGANDDYFLVIETIKPNTTYSVIKTDVGIEDGFYWFKLATSKQTKEYNENNYGAMDGDIQYVSTGGNTKNYTFTSGAEDISVVIVVTKLTAPYVELLEGDYEDFRFPGYGKNRNIRKYTSNLTGKIHVSKYGDDIYINYPSETQNITYTYGLYYKESLNVNVWRLKDIISTDINGIVTSVISSEDNDNEGVIRIDGQADYLGSIHGNEQQTSLNVYIDGVEIDITQSIDRWCESIEFLVGSDIYNADGVAKAFTKVKSNKFTIAGSKIKNRWTSLADVTLTHVRACLLSIEKEYESEKIINTYRDSNVKLIPQNVPDVSETSSTLFSDDNLSDFFVSGDNLNIALISDVRGGSNNTGSLVDFGGRIKPYIDCYTSESVVTNQLIFEDHSFYISTT